MSARRPDAAPADEGQTPSLARLALAPNDTGVRPTINGDPAFIPDGPEKRREQWRLMSRKLYYGDLEDVQYTGFWRNFSQLVFQPADEASRFYKQWFKNCGLDGVRPEDETTTLLAPPLHAFLNFVWSPPTAPNLKMDYRNVWVTIDDGQPYKPLEPDHRHLTKMTLLYSGERHDQAYKRKGSGATGGPGCCPNIEHIIPKSLIANNALRFNPLHPMAKELIERISGDPFLWVPALSTFNNARRNLPLICFDPVPSIHELQKARLLGENPATMKDSLEGFLYELPPSKRCLVALMHFYATFTYGKKMPGLVNPFLYNQDQQYEEIAKLFNNAEYKLRACGQTLFYAVQPVHEADREVNRQMSNVLTNHMQVFVDKNKTRAKTDQYTTTAKNDPLHEAYKIGWYNWLIGQSPAMRRDFLCNKTALTELLVHMFGWKSEDHGTISRQTLQQVLFHANQERCGKYALSCNDTRDWRDLTLRST